MTKHNMDHLGRVAKLNSSMALLMILLQYNFHQEEFEWRSSAASTMITLYCRQQIKGLPNLGASRPFVLHYIAIYGRVLVA